MTMLQKVRNVDYGKDVSDESACHFWMNADILPIT